MILKESKRAKRRARQVRNKGEPEEKGLIDSLSMSPGKPLETPPQPRKLKVTRRGRLRTRVGRLFENFVVQLTLTLCVTGLVTAAIAASAWILWVSTWLDPLLDPAQKMWLTLLLMLGPLGLTVRKVVHIPSRQKIRDLLKSLLSLLDE